MVAMSLLPYFKENVFLSELHWLQFSAIAFVAKQNNQLLAKNVFC